MMNAILTFLIQGISLISNFLERLVLMEVLVIEAVGITGVLGRIGLTILSFAFFPFLFILFFQLYFILGSFNT